MTDKVARPTTCGALALIDATLGEAGCKRLPRHNGGHRNTLHAPKVTRATSTTKGKTRRASKAGLKRLGVKLAADLEAGTVKPSVALSRFAAYVTRMNSQRARRVTARVDRVVNLLDSDTVDTMAAI